MTSQIRRKSFYWGQPNYNFLGQEKAVRSETLRRGGYIPSKRAWMPKLRYSSYALEWSGASKEAACGKGPSQQMNTQTTRQNE